MLLRARSIVTALTVAVTVGLLPGAVVPLAAWGAQGHRVVARLAWALMTPAARAQAAALLEGGQDAFVASATWADEVRSIRPETYNWHFVDIPVGQAHYDAARDCPATDKGDCVIAEIARAGTELAATGGAASANLRRAEALKFLIHFVGDLHQPLHAVDNHDRGGNDVKVAALRGDEGRATNLHAAWDTGLINLSTETEAARADRLLTGLEAHPVDAHLDVVKWAEESHDVGERVVYHYPSFVALRAPQTPAAAELSLDEAYRATAIVTIDRQLQLGGARLAALVNSLLK